jgi:hypothetical protein
VVADIRKILKGLLKIAKIEANAAKEIEQLKYERKVQQEEYARQLDEKERLIADARNEITGTRGSVHGLRTPFLPYRSFACRDGHGMPDSQSDSGVE